MDDPWVEADFKLDMLFEHIIEDVFGLYQIRLTKKDWKHWLECAGKTGLRRTKHPDEEGVEDLPNDEEQDDKNVDIEANIKALLPQEDYLDGEDIHMLLNDFSDEQAAQLKYLFKENDYLTDLIRYRSRFNYVVKYCLTCASEFSSDKISFVITYTDTLIKELSLNDQVHLFNFSRGAKENSWTYFKRKQFIEFAKDYYCKAELFEQFIRCGVFVEANNGWHDFILPEIQDYLSARCIISSADKEQIYQNQFDDFEEPQDLWPYLKQIDEQEFYQSFVLPAIKSFYAEVFDKDKMTLLKKYYNFFNVSIGYSYTDEGLECGNSGNSNWIIDELFTFLNIDLSIGITEIFPCDCYMRKWKKNKSRQNFINYVREIYTSDDGDNEIEYSKIEDQKFWNLLLKTELAEIVYNGVIDLKRMFKFKSN